MNNSTCAANGCDEQAKSVGMCMKHYTRMKRHGDTETVKKTHRRHGCLIDGCNGKHKSNGYCVRHASNLHRHGTPVTYRSSDLPMIDRFFLQVEKTDTCWNWVGVIKAGGYGWFGMNGQAHRFAYRNLVGEIPAGLELDHLCRNRKCVNPSHLEPVTHYENVFRGESQFGINARKTHCIRGHEFDSANTYINKRGGRVCRECRRMHVREYDKRQRLQPHTAVVTDTFN